MNYQISFLLVLAAAMSSAHIGGQAPNQELTKVYCGRSLARTLAILCYDDMPKPLLSSKRADAGMYSKFGIFWQLVQTHRLMNWLSFVLFLYALIAAPILWVELALAGGLIAHIRFNSYYVGNSPVFWIQSR